MPVLAHRVRPSVATFMAASMFIAPTASAGDWKFQTYGNARVTLTDNANLAPSGQQKGDAIIAVTPGISATREGARLKVNVSYAPTGIVYVEGTSNNRFVNTLAARANLEAVENFFFIDGIATISQQFLSPFGPTPTDLSTATSNRTNVTTLGVSPYIRGAFGATGMTYFARNDSYWTTASGSGGNTSYSNYTVARLTSAPATVSWDLEYNRRNTNYSGQSGFLNDIYRGRLFWNVDPQFRVYGIGGYETNNYSVTNRSGPVYGGGLDWHPTDRTTVSGFYEQRFFGPSWSANLTHRRPLSFVSLVGSRLESSYPQAALQLAPGNTAAILDNTLVSRFPDPAARQAEVQRLIQTLGLPASLASPLSFYTQTVFINQRVTLSLGLTGVRNTIILAAWTGYSQQIPATTDVNVQGAFALASQVNQQGVSGIWNHRLTPLTSLNFLASRTQSQSRQPTGSESTTDWFTLDLTRSLGPRTNGALGLRYVIFDTNVGSDYREAAVFAAVSHTF